MKRGILFVAAAALAAGTTVRAQSVPEISFDANAQLLSLPAYGEVAGVARDSRGNIYVYARTGNPIAELGGERTFYHHGSRLFKFDAGGTYIREVGQGTYAMDFGQQVRVDPQDNVWIVDAGSNMLMSFDPEGFFRVALGRKPEAIRVRPGPGVPARAIDPVPEPTGGGGGGFGGNSDLPPGAGIPGNGFSNPTDVAFDAAGHVYVADGFGSNNRIAKFDADGNFVKSWGQTGSEPGQFDKVRGIASDAAANIYVADAGNNRIQVFDSEGTFKSQITGIGSPQAICVSGGSPQYIFSSNSNDSESMDHGEIYKITLDGKVVGKFGRAGHVEGEFGMVNALDCKSATDLLVGEVWNWRVQAVTLK